MSLKANQEFQIRRTAGLLGAIQGTAWIVMSLLCIAYFIKDTSISVGRSYMEQVGLTIYYIYLARDLSPFPNQSLTPTIFFTFMWVYLILDALWFVASIKLMRRSTADQQLLRSTQHWSRLTFLICLVDFITVCCLGADYHNCTRLYVEEADVYIMGEVCANGVLPVLVIAAKGFVLWFVNFAFAEVLYKMARRMKNEQAFLAVTMVPQVVIQSSTGPPLYPARTPDHNSYPGIYPWFQQHQQQVPAPTN